MSVSFNLFSVLPVRARTYAQNFVGKHGVIKVVAFVAGAVFIFYKTYTKIASSIHQHNMQRLQDARVQKTEEEYTQLAGLFSKAENMMRDQSFSSSLKIQAALTALSGYKDTPLIRQGVPVLKKEQLFSELPNRIQDLFRLVCRQNVLSFNFSQLLIDFFLDNPLLNHTFILNLTNSKLCELMAILLESDIDKDDMLPLCHAACGKDPAMVDLQWNKLTDRIKRLREPTAEGGVDEKQVKNYRDFVTLCQLSREKINFTGEGLLHYLKKLEEGIEILCKHPPVLN